MKLEDWIKWAERRAKENEERASRVDTNKDRDWYLAKAQTYQSLAWKLKQEGIEP